MVLYAELGISNSCLHWTHDLILILKETYKLGLS